MESMKDVNGNVLSVFPREGGTSAASCTFCGETSITFPHSCYPDLNKVPDLANRFDPYEALDDITLESAGCSTRSYDAILKQVTALRAYITGMEK